MLPATALRAAASLPACQQVVDTRIHLWRGRMGLAVAPLWLRQYRRCSAAALRRMSRHATLQHLLRLPLHLTRTHK